MRFLLDLHTHTIVSGHAYSTLTENVTAAKKAGLKILGVSDHAPQMPGSTHEFYFGNLRILPNEIDGLRVLKGVELNVMNEAGDIDLGERDLKLLDYSIASLHIPCFKNIGKEGNTNALIHSMKHDKVKIIGHPDDSRYPMDYERLVKAAKMHDVLLEVNNSSLAPTSYRENARENYIEMLELCKKYEVKVIFGSDAHYMLDIGKFEFAIELCKSIDFPEALIINGNPEAFFRAIVRSVTTWE